MRGLVRHNERLQHLARQMDPAHDHNPVPEIPFHLGLAPVHELEMEVAQPLQLLYTVRAGALLTMAVTEVIWADVLNNWT